MYRSKVGLIGLGQWGQNIYRNLETFNVLEKVYDNNLQTLSQFVTNKTKISKSPDEVISAKNVDSIFIASPAATHKEYILRSLLNNKNVFVEKPLCLSLNESQEIKKLLTKQIELFLLATFFNITMHLLN